MSRPRRVAIIPARGGSKRIPGKNVRVFRGRPIIAYTLNTARDSLLFDAIHVSTDDRQIAEIAAEYGAPVAFMRPNNLADDHTPIMPVLRHVVETFCASGREFDQVWMLMACAPLLDTSDLCSASELFDSAGGKQPVLAVTQYPAPIEWAFERNASGALKPLHPGKFAVRSQDLSPRYFDAGLFSAFPTVRVLQSQGAGDDSVFLGHILPRHHSVDIDTEADWQFAELLFDAVRRLRAGQ